MRTPLWTPSCRAMLGRAAWIPKEGRTTSPLSISCSTGLAMAVTGSAKPTPLKVPLVVKMAVLMPGRAVRETTFSRSGTGG